MPESGHFQRIYHTVVSMCRVGYLETWCAIGLKLFLIVLNNPGKISRKSSLLSKEWRIRKKDNRFSCGEYTLDHRHSLVGWPCQVFLTNSYLALLLSHVGCINPCRFQRCLFSWKCLIHLCLESFSIWYSMLIVLILSLLLLFQDRIPFLNLLQFGLFATNILTLTTAWSLFCRISEATLAKLGGCNCCSSRWEVIGVWSCLIVLLILITYDAVISAEQVDVSSIKLRIDDTLLRCIKWLVSGC